MKINNLKILTLFFLIFLVSCKKKSTSNQKFDIETFITNYKFRSQINDSILIKKIRDTLIINKDEWYVVMKYGHFFNNKDIYMIVLDQIKGKSYYWFKKTDHGFVSFRKRKITDWFFIKDTILDINNDGIYELGMIKQPRGIGPDYIDLYFLNNNGLIEDSTRIRNYFKIRNNQFIQAYKGNSPLVYIVKCQWNKTKIDTIENVFYDWNNGNKTKYYIIKNDSPFIENNKLLIDKSKIIKTLNKLPNDYQKVLKKYYPELNKQ